MEDEIKKEQTAPERQNRQQFAYARKAFISRTALLVCVCMMAMGGSALASDGGSSGSTSVTSGVSTVVEIVGQVFTLITGNPLLMVFVGAGLVGVGVRIFRQIKSAAR